MFWHTILVASRTTTTGALIILFIRPLIWHGGHKQWKDVQAITMHNCPGLIHEFGTQVQKQLTSLLLTGMMITTGCVHLCTSSHGAHGMLKTSPSAVFWPILFPNPDRLAAFVKAVINIHKLELLIHPGKMGANIFRGTPNTNMLVVRFDFQDRSDRNYSLPRHA